jgi:hypothetical protein
MLKTGIFFVSLPSHLSLPASGAHPGPRRSLLGLGPVVAVPRCTEVRLLVARVRPPCCFHSSSIFFAGSGCLRRDLDVAVAEARRALPGPSLRSPPSRLASTRGEVVLTDVKVQGDLLRESCGVQLPCLGSGGPGAPARPALMREFVTRTAIGRVPP